MPLLDKVVRGTKAFIKEANTPESYVSGQRFEDFVKKMFPSYDWALDKMTQGYNANKERYEEKSMEPDFRFRHKKSNRLINVECKFRKGLFKDKIEWCKPYQMKRYQEINKKFGNVHIIIGFGGTPSNPEKIYAFPLSDVKYNAVYQSYIRKFEKSKNHRFRLNYGRLN